MVAGVEICSEYTLSENLIQELVLLLGIRVGGKTGSQSKECIVGRTEELQRLVHRRYTRQVEESWEDGLLEDTCEPRLSQFLDRELSEKAGQDLEAVSSYAGVRIVDKGEQHWDEEWPMLGDELLLRCRQYYSRSHEPSLESASHTSASSTAQEKAEMALRSSYFHGFVFRLSSGSPLSRSRSMYSAFRPDAVTVAGRDRENRGRR